MTVGDVMPLNCYRTCTYGFFLTKHIENSWQWSDTITCSRRLHIIFRLHDNSCTEHVQYNGVQGYKAIPHPSDKEAIFTIYSDELIILYLLYSMEICVRCTCPSSSLKCRKQLPSLCTMVLLYITSHNVCKPSITVTHRLYIQLSAHGTMLLTELLFMYHSALHACLNTITRNTAAHILWSFTCTYTCS